jgi:hypothetical protein
MPVNIGSIEKIETPIKTQNANQVKTVQLNNRIIIFVLGEKFSFVRIQFIIIKMTNEGKDANAPNSQNSGRLTRSNIETS